LFVVITFNLQADGIPCYDYEPFPSEWAVKHKIRIPNDQDASTRYVAAKKDRISCRSKTFDTADLRCGASPPILIIY
jgi:hypothetical protein